MGTIFGQFGQVNNSSRGAPVYVRNREQFFHVPAARSLKKDTAAESFCLDMMIGYSYKYKHNASTGRWQES